MKHVEDARVRTLDLSASGWNVRLADPQGSSSPAPKAIRGREFTAVVPGCIHTDLMRAGMIPDPAVDRNELEIQWVGECDWTYRRRFVIPQALLEHQRVELVCDGLDTIAEVAMNGRAIGSTANMFRPHRFDVGAMVKPGENELAITFRSPLKHIRAEEARIGPRPVNGDWDPYVFIRKAACNFGWDWGPKVATSGVWRPIRIEAWNGVRIASVRPLAHRESGDRWTVQVHVELDWAKPRRDDPVSEHRVVARLADDDGERSVAGAVAAPGQVAVVIPLTIDRPRLWWPRGWGRQDLCGLRVTLGARCTLGEWSAAIGIRHVRLITDPDDIGSRFALEVNGREVFCKGANWIPEGLLPADRPPHRVRQRLAQVAAANMNMLRVWGGGFYEDDAFYEECDRLGIMVWQDFMFACAMYPEEEPIRGEVALEARHQIVRLSRHPSVVLWCGGNECTWSHESWGGPPHGLWKDRLGNATWGAGYYFDVLPRLVAELDPTRPYWPNSPWPGRELVPGKVSPNDASHGDRHTWDERVEGYTTLVPRFCSEFGHQSPANRRTLARVMSEHDLVVGSPGLEHRQRGTGGTACHIDEALTEWFRPFRNLDEWHYLSQLLQARAMQIGIGWLRANQPRCMGALVWQLNDAWPGLSWSLIDADGGEKPAYRSVREACRERIITIGPRHGRPAVFMVNDTDSPWCGELRLRTVAFDGTDLGRGDVLPFEVPLRSARHLVEIESICGRPRDPRREVIVAESDGLRTCRYHLPDRELNYPAPSATIAIEEPSSGRLSAKVHAISLLRDVGGQVAGRQLRSIPGTLLPGETICFDIDAEQSERTDQAFPARGLMWPPGLWCANLFGAIDHIRPERP